MKLSPAQVRLLRRISAGPESIFHWDTARSLQRKSLAEFTHFGIRLPGAAYGNCNGTEFINLRITEAGQAALKDL